MPPAVVRSLRKLTAPLPHAGTFAAVAGLVVYGDYVTKQVAVGLWSGESYPLLGRLLRIHVVHNTLGAFGTSVGSYTWEVNVGATVVAILLAMAISSRLALLDGRAPAALGLVAGAGMGNFTSLVGSPVGVPDFLAVSDGQGGLLVMNVADLAAYIGIACCIRIAWALGRAVWRGTGARSA